MLAALAGVVHDRQRAYGHERDRNEGNYKGGLHFDLAIADPRAAKAEFPSLKLNQR